MKKILIVLGDGRAKGNTRQLVDAFVHGATDVGRILRTFKIKKNVEVTDNGKIII